MAKRDAAMASFANRLGEAREPSNRGSVMRDLNRLARGAGYSILRSLGFALFNWLPRSNPKLEPLSRQWEGDVERIARVDPTSAKQLRAERAANHQLLDPPLGSIARDDDGGDAAINPIKAIESGNLAEFRRFVQANPQAMDAVHEPDQYTLLHHLAALGSNTLPVHSTMALELVKAGADVNCRTLFGWTPLMLIAMHGQKEAVSLTKTLIGLGGDVGAVDKHGCDWTFHWQHGEEIRTVLDAAMTPAQKEANRLHLEQLYSPKRS